VGISSGKLGKFLTMSYISKNMINLSKQVVIISGGSRGIGRATAVLFAMAGADVVILYNKNRTAASKTVQLLRALGVFGNLGR
jgi:NAD(P)-dependent dehydrogenase (short-subunit alcohol dehydrogenase family)